MEKFLKSNLEVNIFQSLSRKEFALIVIIHLFLVVFWLFLAFICAIICYQFHEIDDWSVAFLWNLLFSCQKCQAQCQKHTQLQNKKTKYDRPNTFRFKKKTMKKNSTQKWKQKWKWPMPNSGDSGDFVTTIKHRLN